MKLTIKRDLFFLAALVLMIRVAFKQPKKIPQRSALLTSAQQASQANEPFCVHETDKTVVSQIKTVEKQVEQTISLTPSESEHVAELQNMKLRLQQLKRKYLYTSPAIVLLGPIGYAGVVFKEQAIEKDVLKISNRCNTILHDIVKPDRSNIPAHTLADGIQAHAATLQITAQNNVELNEVT